VTFCCPPLLRNPLSVIGLRSFVVNEFFLLSMIENHLRFCFCFSVASCVFFLLCTTTLFDAYLPQNIDDAFEKKKNLSNSLDIQMNSITAEMMDFGSSTLQDADPRRIVGFFNLFEKDSEVFSRIVHEQISFIESSGVLDRVAFILYVYFGPNYSEFVMPSTSQKYVKSPISNATGEESDTLQLVHEHCLRHPEDRVFYLHSKGSFRPRPQNDLLRRNLMKGLLSCILAGDAVGQSDVGGLRVSPVPYPQISGAQRPCPSGHPHRTSAPVFDPPQIF